MTWEKVFYNSVGTYVQYINNELSKELNMEPLSKHLKLVGGYAFKTSEYKKDGIPIIRISDFNDEKIVLDSVVYYSESDNLKKYELNSGDIIIALTGGTIAKLAIVQANLGKIYLNQRVGKFEVLKPDEFEKEYIYWIARSIQNIIKNLAWGAAIPNVSPKQIEELRFPFPNKKIQSGIIMFLNDLKNNQFDINKNYFNQAIELKIVSLHLRQLATDILMKEISFQMNIIKKLRQQILQDAIQGKLVKQDKSDEPASILLEKIKAEKAQLIADKKLKKDKVLQPIKPEEIPFDIPDNWVWCRLGEILTFGPSNGYSPQESKTGDGIKCLTLTATTSGKFKKQFFKFVDVNIDKDSYLWLEPKDILIQRGNSIDFVGIAAIYDDKLNEYIYPDLMIKMRVPDYMNTIFIHKVLISPFKRIDFQSKASGAQKSMPKINQTIIINTLIPLPPINEQNRIVAKVEELMKTCDELEQNIKNNQKYTEQLMQVALKEALTHTSTSLSNHPPAPFLEKEGEKGQLNIQF